jgi:hypothetical protein
MLGQVSGSDASAGSVAGLLRAVAGSHRTLSVPSMLVITG